MKHIDAHFALLQIKNDTMVDCNFIDMLKSMQKRRFYVGTN